MENIYNQYTCVILVFTKTVEYWLKQALCLGLGKNIVP